MAACIIIDRALTLAGGAGHVWIPAWYKDFQPAVGTFRAFVEERPARYGVLGLGGDKFAISLIGDRATVSIDGQVSENEALKAMLRVAALNTRGGETGLLLPLLVMRDAALRTAAMLLKGTKFKALGGDASCKMFCWS